MTELASRGVSHSGTLVVFSLTSAVLVLSSRVLCARHALGAGARGERARSAPWVGHSP